MERAGRLSLLESAATIKGVVTNLLDHIEQSIRARMLLSRRQGILVAVSGGLDSMTLLHVLQRLAVNHAWRLTVAHLNHQLRGRSSDGDERFVRATCARLKLACVVERADVRAHAKERGLSIEMAARKLRHEFLARTAKQLGLSTVALAHHADDQVELFFLRLLRGTGSDGLAGMKWRTPSPVEPNIKLVRPLLDVSREDLESFARKCKIRFREDASNASRDILRNRIRHELLPLLRRRFQPAVNRTVLRLMEIIGADSELLTGLTRSHFKSKKTLPFASLPVGLQRRMLQVQLQQRDLLPDFELIERLRDNPDKPVNISSLMSVSRDGNGVVQLRAHAPADFNPNTLSVALAEKAGERVFDGVHFRWQLKMGKDDPRIQCRPGRELFDAGKIGPRILLRHWRAGDQFQPIGMHSTVKIQDWFTNRKIPRAMRHQLVVAATATGEIFWIEGQRISERFKLTPRTQKQLIWRWQRLQNPQKSCVAVVRRPW